MASERWLRSRDAAENSAAAATLARELKGGGLNWSTCQRQAYSAMLAPFSKKSATLGSSADASVIFPLRN